MKTCFVIGAGASYEVGLPTGAELKSEIAEALDIRYTDGYTLSRGDRTIAEAFQEMHRAKNISANELQHAGWRIRDAMPQAISIDNFIDVNGNAPLVKIAAKMAIVSRILAAEQRSKLQHLRDWDRGRRVDMDLAGVADTWFAEFFQVLTENCPPDKLTQRLSDISLVIFNYDRCIERYLAAAFVNYYDLTEEEARAHVDELKIFHPYGQVGQLPKSGVVGVPYGSKVHSRSLVELIELIKTFSESTDVDDETIVSLRRHVLEADRLIFLGFAFHPLNLDLILPREVDRSSSNMRAIYGTAYRMSSDDVEVVKDDLHARFAERISKVQLRTDLVCTELFRQYRRSLSMA